MKQLDKLDINDLKTFDIKEYIFKVLSHWKLFVLMLILALIIAMFINKRKQRIYNLNSIITVKEEQNPLFTSSTNIAFNWGGPSDKVETMKTILTSRTHNEKVVRKLQYYIDYLKDGTYRMEDVYGKVPFSIDLDSNGYQLLNTNIKLEFLENNEVLVSVDFVEDEFKLINYETVNTKDYIPDVVSYSKKFASNNLIKNSFLEFKIKPKLKGQSIANSTYYIRFKSFNGVVKQYANIKVDDVKKGTSIIEMSLNGANKKKIEDYINTSIDVLDKDQQAQKIAYAIRTKEYIDQVFELAANNLETIEKDLGNFKQQSGVYDLSMQGQQLLVDVSVLDNQQEEIKNRLNYFNNLENYIVNNNDIGSDIPVPANVTIEDPNMAKNMADLIELSKQKKTLEKTVKADYPPLQDIQNRIEITRKVVIENLSSLKNETKSSLSNIRSRIGTYNSRLRTLPKKEQGLIKFERNYNLTAANYEYLKQKQYEAGTAIAANVSDIKILDKAKDIGQGPISPNTKLNYLIGAILGLGLPFAYVLIKEALSNKIITVEEIEKTYKIPVLGVVGSGKIDSYLAVFDSPKSSLAESFRALRSNIQFLFKKGGSSKTIVLTSSVSGEGKTLCSINMASVFAMSEKKTILIGLDLRKPKLHIDFELGNEVGVVNYLIGQKELHEVIQSSRIPNLDIITSGPVPPNPSELLISDQANDMMAYLKEHYDYIIIDTPPVGLVADAIELFKYSDAIIYIIRQNYTQRGMPKMIDDKYVNGEVKNISYVLNDFKIKDTYGYGYGYGYGSYGKYGNGYHADEKQPWLKRLFKK